LMGPLGSNWHNQLTMIAVLGDDIFRPSNRKLNLECLNFLIRYFHRRVIIITL